METLEFLSAVWLDYFNGKASIEEVLDEYGKHGFDANQDLPGNMHWEELYKASPKGTKVILTVRSTDDEWFDSFYRFEKQQTARWSYGNFNIVGLGLANRGYMGKKFQNMGQGFSSTKTDCKEYIHVYHSYMFLRIHFKIRLVEWPRNAT